MKRLLCGFLKIKNTQSKKFIWTQDTMGVAQFYLHLPNNSSLDKFPNNTLTEYRVGLPQTVSLTGDWEVGWTEIHYPRSWNNVQGNLQDRFYVWNQELSGVREVRIPPSHYASIEAILSKMKELVDNKKRFNDNVRFSYDTLSRKGTVHLQNNAELFFGDIGYVLRFSPKEVISQTSTAKRDLDHRLRSQLLWSICLLCYCSTTICWGRTCSPTSTRPSRGKGWTTGQQIFLLLAICTCLQKAVRKYQSQYKAGHRRNRTIRVWESVAYTLFSTEQTRELLKRWRKFTPQITSCTTVTSLSSFPNFKLKLLEFSVKQLH